MRAQLRVAALLFLAIFVSAGIAADGQAATVTYLLHDHPDGTQNPPPYGFRWDDLLGPGAYTFSFDYSDVSGSAQVFLDYDDVANTIRIHGRAYGGKDIGATYDAVESGWIDIDFTYNANVNANVDNAILSPGDDYYVINEDLSNAGSFTLDGWGGDITVNMTDKFFGASGYSFNFDNDSDSKGNAGIAGDPNIFSGNGWLAPPGGSARDWIFIGELMTPLPVENTSVSRLKKDF
ncbi:MAG: hypothetical protein HKN21_08500 [Candidatus Eisenbacteria bacterium]|uniref:PEP-CTERM sorting domain-containing protein n=1 Tax=Eiseniibacteriota bacterium TaxID=2212470 RepID=A0A7Y2H2I9_UNCEI|nr:hypothetical protein [Candidatus Eisenbacteria bacterium]